MAVLGLPKPSYWAGRAEERLLSYERDSGAVVDTLRSAYQQAQRDIARDALSIIRNFQQGFDLTEEEARLLLAQPVGRAEYETLLRRIAQIQDPALRLPLEARAASGAYGYRLQRQEALRMNIDAQVTRLAEIERAADARFFEHLIPEAHDRAVFDIQQGIGLRYSFAQMDAQAVREILRNPWSGKHFSTTIWNNTTVKLAGELNERITAAFLTGRSTARVSRESMERLQVGYHAAERVVRTETNYMANAATMQGYRDAGIEKYVFMANLDNRTSAICQALDLKEFRVSDAVPGKNQPPMHPNCRSYTVVLIDGDTLADLQRRARNPETGEWELVPGDMTYGEWKQWQKAGAPGNIEQWRNINNPDYINTKTRGVIATHDGTAGFNTLSDVAIQRVSADTGLSAADAQETAVALEDYFGYHYSEIRSKTTPEFAEKSDLIERYVRLSPKYDMEMFRGISLSEEAVHAIIQGETGPLTEGISSWSAEQPIAEEFSDGESGNIRVVLRLPKSGRAAYVAHISPYGTGEQEIIMLSGGKLKYIGQREANKMLYIDVEEVGP